MRAAIAGVLRHQPGIMVFGAPGPPPGPQEVYVTGQGMRGSAITPPAAFRSASSNSRSPHKQMIVVPGSATTRRARRGLRGRRAGRCRIQASSRCG